MQVVSCHRGTGAMSHTRKWVQLKVENNIKPLSKIVSELNLEIPKTYENIVQYFSEPRLEDGKEPTSNKIETPLIESRSSVEHGGKKHVVCGLISDKRPVHLRGVCLEDKSAVVDREQFSFEEAMLNADTQYVIEPEQSQIGCNKKYVNVIKALTKVYTESSKC